MTRSEYRKMAVDSYVFESKEVYLGKLMANLVKKSHRGMWIGLAVILSVGFLSAVGESPVVLDQLVNYPNPFDSRREETTISYQLAQDLSVRVKIYDLFGYKVKEFTFSPGEEGGRAGINELKWNGTDETGSKVSMGGYVCQVIVEGDQPVRSIRKIGVVH